MKNFQIYGKIREAESGKGIPDLVVEAKDADLFVDQLIGVARSGQDGSFAIDYPPLQATPDYREKPDIYLNIKLPDGQLIVSTRSDIKTDVESSTEINVNLSRESRIATELEQAIPAADAAGSSGRWTSWTFLPDKMEQSALLQQIQKDLSGQTSILAVLKQYMDELYLNPDNNALPFSKIMEIFGAGVAPEAIEGHFYGVWMFFRTGDQEEPFSPIGNVLQILLGTTLDAQCPWVGKTLRVLSQSEFDALTDGSIKPDRQVFHVTNHFRKMDRQIPNNLTLQLLNIWAGLEDAPPEEQKKYGHQKNGAYMIAVKSLSMYSKTSRDVFVLNYRWKNLANMPPLCWMIDEVVEIARGLYLGQILSATRRLLGPYDPARLPEDYAYQTFGYFLIFSGDWNMEAARLFPFLEIR